MKSISYNVPETLEAEKRLLEEYCDILISAFNEKCNAEVKRLAQLREERRRSRQFVYSIVELEGGWQILHKESTEKIGEADDVCWSRPFKIENNVLYHDDFSYKNMSWARATDLIPQGILPEGFDIHKINTGW